MAKQSQKSKDNNTEILHTMNTHTQIIRSRRKRIEMLLTKKNLQITFKTF